MIPRLSGRPTSVAPQRRTAKLAVWLQASGWALFCACAQSQLFDSAMHSFSQREVLKSGRQNGLMGTFLIQPTSCGTGSEKAGREALLLSVNCQYIHRKIGGSIACMDLSNRATASNDGNAALWVNRQSGNMFVAVQNYRDTVLTCELQERFCILKFIGSIEAGTQDPFIKWPGVPLR
jgi:hypothetical protein